MVGARAERPRDAQRAIHKASRTWLDWIGFSEGSVNAAYDHLSNHIYFAAAEPTSLKNQRTCSGFTGS